MLSKRTLGLAIAAATMTLAAGVALGGTIHCPGGPCTGSFGNDPMLGTPGEDVIRGLGGNDSIEPDAGDDIAYGGPGRDDLSEYVSESGDDELLGGPGSDVRLEGGSGRDVLRGGPGDERAGKDILRGKKGKPTFRLIEMFGDEGPDRIFGGRGDDSIEGEEGADFVSAGPGNDYVDAIDDDDGNDRDVVRCGKGFDRYSARSEDAVAGDCEKKVPATDA